MSFGNKEFAELARGYAEIHGRYAALQVRYLSRHYRNEVGREYAVNGFCRRLGTLVRCIDRVFEVLPPNRGDIPERDEVVDATINLQAFVANVYGCCDNLAWVWVYEKGVTDALGKQLAPTLVGLGEKYKEVWKSFSPDFVTYLNSRQTWFAYVKDFRDALAHRIPLYIPPYCLVPKNEGEHRRLEVAMSDALRAGDLTRHEQLTADQERLGTFQPIIVHSLNQPSACMRFHPQMLADFHTIEEIGYNFLEELAK